MTLFIVALVCLPQTLRDIGVYAPLLDESYHGVPASQMVVKDMAIKMPSLQGSAREWLKQFEDVPIALRRLATAASPTRPRQLDGSLFPAGTRLAPGEPIDAIFSGRDLEENWAAFRTQFKARGWIAFSDSLLGVDNLNALVYYESRCGGLCGEGGYVWLRRETAASPWRIAKKIVSWMS